VVDFELICAVFQPSHFACRKPGSDPDSALRTDNAGK
jgi:hypothetical protein